MLLKLAPRSGPLQQTSGGKRVSGGLTCGQTVQGKVARRCGTQLSGQRRASAVTVGDAEGYEGSGRSKGSRKEGKRHKIRRT